MEKIEELKALIEAGTITIEDALALVDWINEKAGKGPSTQSDDNPPHKPGNP